MITREFHRTRTDGVNLYKTYSDENFYIVKEGTTFKYAVAIDVENAPFTYIETEEKIPERILTRGIKNGTKDN